MLKDHAINILGGSLTVAAKECRVTPQAIADWPEVLPPRIADRIEAALWRRLTPGVQARALAKRPKK